MVESAAQLPVDGRASKTVNSCNLYDKR